MHTNKVLMRYHLVLLHYCFLPPIICVFCSASYLHCYRLANKQKMKGILLIASNQPPHIPKNAIREFFSCSINRIAAKVISIHCPFSIFMKYLHCILQLFIHNGIRKTFLSKSFFLLLAF